MTAPSASRARLAGFVEAEYGPGVMLLDPPELDRAIVGFTVGGPARAVYTYDGLVEALAKTMDSAEAEADAREWIDYNTVRSLPYMGEHAPVVVEIPDWLEPAGAPVPPPERGSMGPSNGNDF